MSLISFWRFFFEQKELFLIYHQLLIACTPTLATILTHCQASVTWSNKHKQIPKNHKLLQEKCKKKEKIITGKLFSCRGGMILLFPKKKWSKKNSGKKGVSLLVFRFSNYHRITYCISVVHITNELFITVCVIMPFASCFSLHRSDLMYKKNEITLCYSTGDKSGTWYNSWLDWLP